MEGAECGQNDIAESCSYGIDLRCTCPRADPDSGVRQWHCTHQPSACVTANHDPVADAGGLPMDARLSDLTPEQVRRWCQWVFDRRGFRPGTDFPIYPEEVPGYASSRYGSLSCGGPLRACMQTLPLDLCVQNILRVPRCEATVQDLSDCVATMVNHCFRVGRGCASLRAAPNCLQTIVQVDTRSGCSTPLR